MIKVSVPDPCKLEFLTNLLGPTGIYPFEITYYTNGLSVSDGDLAKLIERYANGKATVLPFLCPEEQCVLWVVRGNDKRELHKTDDELRHFLTPVWAEIYPANESMAFLAGMPDAFPFGLRLFRTPINLIKQALDLLGKWADLVDMRPIVEDEKGKIDVYMLRSQFQNAIALQDWNEATKLLDIIRQGHYLSDENHLFLRIQLLSAQQRWNELWNDNDFGLASGLDPLPAKVRGALLTAFYMSVIAPYGEDMNGALTAYESNRYRLGALLRYRSGIEGNLPLLVFCYEASWNQDVEKLNSIATNITSDENLAVIERLLLVVNKGNAEISKPQVEATVQEGNSLRLAKSAFGEGLYDEAYLNILNYELGLERVRLMLRLAKITEDTHICTQVRYEYTALKDSDKNALMSLQTDQNSVKWVLGYQTDNLTQHTVRLPLNWLEWFSNISENENLRLLFDHYKDFEQRADLLPVSIQGWSKIQSIFEDLALNDQLDTLQRQLLKRSLPGFVNNVVVDSSFPHVLHQELYDCVLYALRTWCSNTETNLSFQGRIIEGILRLEPIRASKLFMEMYDDLKITPSLQLSPSILSFIEVFYDYGVTNRTITTLWNEWMGYLALKFSHDRITEAESWLYYGECLVADAYLLEQLRKKTQTPLTVDPIKMLSKQKIVIFSLRQQAAERAAKRIRARNGSLNIIICKDESMTVSAKQHASNADISIIVTACLSHALFYGIMPHLKNPPIYPRDAGETGIVQILEEYALNIFREAQA